MKSLTNWISAQSLSIQQVQQNKNVLFSDEQIIFFTLSEFFTSVLAHVFSLVFEWEQVLSLQDSSRYSGRSQ